MLCKEIIESTTNKVLQKSEFGFTRPLVVESVSEKPSRFYIRFVFDCSGQLLEFPVPKSISKDHLEEDLVFRVHKLLNGLRASHRRDYDDLCKNRQEYESSSS